MTDEQFSTMIQTFAAQLGEHCDAVQILCTRNLDGCTESFYRGCGNWYARQGMCHEFIQQDIAQENAKQIANATRPPDEQA